MTKLAYFKRIIKYLSDYKYVITIGVIFAILSIFCSMVVPKISKNIIDEVLVERKFNLLKYYTLLLSSFILLKAISNYLQGYIFEYTSQKVLYALRDQIYTKLQHQSFEFFDKASTGAIMNRMVGDLEAIRNFLNQSIIQIISFSITIISALWIMLSMNVYLTLLSLLITPLIYLNVNALAKKLNPVFKKTRVAFEKLTSKVQENITGIRVVKAFGNEELEKRNFEKVAYEFTQMNIKAADIRSTNMPIANFLNGLNMVIILVIGGYLAIHNKISIGTLFAFISYVNIFSGPIGHIQNLVNQWHNAFASFEKIFELIDTDVKIKNSNNSIKVKNIKGDIKFKNVYFKYNKNYVLKGIDIHIKPKEKIAILGSTGSGKSSLINLLARFYDCDKGEILLDDTNIKNIKLCSLRKQIGIIMQETFIFSDTIAANIAFGKPDATMEEIKWAAKMAQADEFIEKMPNGYETIVGERGLGLSGGQKQRLAIARALIYNPKILILDDATASLDFETEAEIQKTLSQVIQERTTIIITHRISQLVINADRIIYLSNGQIVEEGNHEELIKLKGKYYSIYKKQLLERLNTLSA